MRMVRNPHRLRFFFCLIAFFLSLGILSLRCDVNRAIEPLEPDGLIHCSLR